MAERVPGGFLPDGDQGFLLAFILGMGTLVGVFLIPCSYVFIMKLFRIKFSLNELKEDPDEGRPGNTWPPIRKASVLRGPLLRSLPSGQCRSLLSGAEGSTLPFRTPEVMPGRLREWTVTAR